MRWTQRKTRMFLAGILAMFLTAAATTDAQAWAYTFDANCEGWSFGGEYGQGTFPGPFRVVGQAILTTGAPYGEPGASAPVEVSIDEVNLPASPNSPADTPWSGMGAAWTVELDGVYYATLIHVWYSDYPGSPWVHTGDTEPVMFECHPETGFAGLTPGYWKNHLSAWVGYSPTDDFDTIFGVNAFNPNKTLLEALRSGGGGVIALGRHASAALLNAAHPSINYPMSTAQVIAAVQAAFAPGGDVEDTKDMLEDYNQLGVSISLKSPNTTAGKSSVAEVEEVSDNASRKAAKAAEKAAKKAAKEAEKAAKKAAKEARKAGK